jgi:gluconate 2-dehydrogenase gamma chain
MSTHDDSPPPVSPARRRFFQAAGAAGAAAALPGPASAQQKRPPTDGYVFFNPAEVAFIEAAVARLIPKDEAGPGALEAGVPQYIDRQLVGAWGAGDRLYRSGPWHPGTASQGYQLPFTPAELFRNAVRAINEDLGRKKTPFARMAPHAQDAYLDSLQKGSADLGGVPSNVFFESLLEVTIEGFFCDPAYGGNRDMAAWKMIGFPGAYADFYEFVDKHGIAFAEPPTSLAQDASGRVHLHPVRVARKGK